MEFSHGQWIVEDTISNFRRSAKISWRLAPDSWTLKGNVCEGSLARLELTGNAPLIASLVEGWESRYYLERTSLPVLEAIIEKPGSYSVTTLIQLK